MFNRHIYEKYEVLLETERQKSREKQLLAGKHREEIRVKTEKYKERVRDFLIKMATKPLVLGQYIPPVKDIVKNYDQTKNLANAQLYINGFKTNKERLERVISDHKILDYTPTPVSALNHQYRSRYFEKQIQPGMRFQGNNSSKSVNLTASRSSTKLPAITQRTFNPELKLHFKGVEEMGNKLKSMEQRQADRIGLLNKLQAVYGGGDITLQKASFDVLQSCKLNKSKTISILKNSALKTNSSVI